MRAMAPLGEMRSVVLSAGEIAYGDTGTGPPVVFLHPLLASAEHWRNVVPAVAAGGLRCLTPTLPLGAHGVAMRPDADLTPTGQARLIVEFLDALELGPVTLVGNDTGGALAQFVAAEFPAQVERLVLTNCDAFEAFFPPLFRYLQVGAKIPGFATAVGQSLRVRSLRRLPVTFGWLAKRPIPDHVLDGYAAPFLADAQVRRDVVKFLRGVDNLLTLAAAERLRSFAQPVLLAWAVEDRVFPLRLARRLHEVLPRATLLPIEDSYAFTPEDQPAVLARMIVEFCGS